MQRVLLILLLCCLSACASKPRSASPHAYTPLPEAVRAELASMETLVGLSKQEIVVGNPDYAGLPLRRAGQFGGAGLELGLQGGRGANGKEVLISLAVTLGAVVVGTVLGLAYGTAEASVVGYQHQMASRAAAPLQQSAADIDFGARLRAALDRPDGPLLLLRDGQITPVLPATEENFAAHHAMSGHDTVLLVRFHASLSADLNTLSLHGEARLIPKSDRMWRLQYEHFRKGERTDRLPGNLQTDPRHALYRRSLVFRSTLATRQSDRDKAAQAWAANEGERLRAVFGDGLDLLARLIADDLAGKPVPARLSLGERQFLIEQQGGLTAARRAEP